VELTPVSFIERAGTVFAERPALVDGDLNLNWAQVRARSRRLASAVRKAGIKKGDRVAFVALNSEPLLVAHFGIPQAGAVIVAVNTRLTATEVGYIVRHSDSRIVFFSPELRNLIQACPASVRRVEIGPQFEAFMEQGSDDPIDSWLASEDEIVAIDYTSGTTGQPKGVVYQHRGAFLNAIAMVVENRLSCDSNHLWTLPMFHCNGWSHTWAMAAAGSKSVCIPRVDAGEVWRLIEDENITHFNAAPTVLIMLGEDPGAKRLTHRVRVCTGGAPPSPVLISRMEDFNIELVHLYGLTETYGPCTINVVPPSRAALARPEQAEYRARQGFAHVIGGQVQVVDDAMEPLPGDGASLGEVVVRGNTLMRGYFKQPKATAEAFRGGWFHTGDLGVVHKDGSIELLDRQKDIIVSGGENVSTIEVERAIMSHPAVSEAAVIAVPDQKWGEVPKAFISLKPGSEVSEAEIIAFVKARISHFKAPKTVQFGTLPKTSTGKVQKYILRDGEWRGRIRRIN
jgi:fatty-acyl-CoA synthase